MAARAECAELIARLRVLIGDPDETAYFSDSELQNYLDGRKIRVNMIPLKALPTYTESEITYFVYAAPIGDWDTAVTFKGQDYADLTLDEGDYINGVFTLTADAPPPTYMAVGNTYDLYGAAHDALLSWASELSLDFDFSLNGQVFHASQQEMMKRQMARDYAKKSRPRTYKWTRGDLNG